MNGEERPGESLDQLTVLDRSLQGWRDWLLGDELDGDLAVPCSRYGFFAGDCAWWAVGATAAFIELGGVADEPEELVNYFMSQAVNDDAGIAELVAEAWADLPTALQEQLGDLEHVRGMADGQA